MLPRPRILSFRIEQAIAKEHKQHREVEHTEVDGIIRHDLLGDQAERRRHCKGGMERLWGNCPAMQVCFIAHAQQKKDIQKALPARERIRIMKTVPDEIQNIDTEAQVKKDEQQPVHQLAPHRNSRIHKIHRQQQEDDGSGIDIRPMIQALLRFDKRHLSCKHVNDGEILRCRLRKGEVTRSRHLQGIDLRQQRHCGETACDQRIYRKTQDAEADLPRRPHALQYIKTKKIDDHEDTGHNGNIIIGKNGEAKGQHIKHAALSPHQLFQSQHDQWKQNDAVQPHDVPAVGGNITGHGIQNRKDRTAQVTLREAMTKIKAHAHTGKTDLDDDHIGHKLQDQSLRT